MKKTPNTWSHTNLLTTSGNEMLLFLFTFSFSWKKGVGYTHCQVERTLQFLTHKTFLTERNRKIKMFFWRSTKQPPYDHCWLKKGCTSEGLNFWSWAIRKQETDQRLNITSTFSVDKKAAYLLEKQRLLCVDTIPIKCTTSNMYISCVWILSQH